MTENADDPRLRIWSFPMRYQPTDRPDRSHVGEKWTRYQLRAMQIILQATHGIVSGTPEFFKRAFGDTFDEFQRILLLPHDYIFNRDWYERFDGQAEFDEYQAVAGKLDKQERAELLALLSSCDPRHFSSLADQTANPNVRRVLPFYIPKSKSELFEIWDRQRMLTRTAAVENEVAEDERVEDAGLEPDEAAMPAILPRSEQRKQARAAR